LTPEIGRKRRLPLGREGTGFDLKIAAETLTQEFLGEIGRAPNRAVRNARHDTGGEQARTQIRQNRISPKYGTVATSRFQQ